jgi:hypothetical protein
MKPRAVSTIIFLSLLVLISFYVFNWTSNFPYACRIENPSAEDNEITASIAILDKILDPGLTFSTTLAAFGAAILLRWKLQINLTFTSRLIIFAATLFFVQSGIYASLFNQESTPFGSAMEPHKFFQVGVLIYKF